jgi:hypothetical protein
MGNYGFNYPLKIRAIIFNPLLMKYKVMQVLDVRYVCNLTALYHILASFIAECDKAVIVEFNKFLFPYDSISYS